MKYVLTLAALAVAVSPAFSDEVRLKDGSVINGIIHDNAKDPNKLEIEVGVGTVWVDRNDVLSREAKHHPLHEYYERYAGIRNSKKSGDYMSLATWAKENKLSKFVRPLMETALKLDPNNESAHRELGHQMYKGKWMTREEANKAKGLVEFEGRWITTADRELILQKRLAAKERAEQAKADAKRREEEERKRRLERIQDYYDTLNSPAGYYYYPSEFWPAYYRAPASGYAYGGYYGYPGMDYSYPWYPWWTLPSSGSGTSPFMGPSGAPNIKKK